MVASGVRAKSIRRVRKTPPVRKPPPLRYEMSLHCALSSVLCWSFHQSRCLRSLCDLCGAHLGKRVQQWVRSTCRLTPIYVASLSFHQSRCLTAMRPVWCSPREESAIVDAEVVGSLPLAKNALHSPTSSEVWSPLGSCIVAHARIYHRVPQRSGACRFSLLLLAVGLVAGLRRGKALFTSYPSSSFRASLISEVRESRRRGAQIYLHVGFFTSVSRHNSLIGLFPSVNRCK